MNLAEFSQKTCCIYTPQDQPASRLSYQLAASKTAAQQKAGSWVRTTWRTPFAQ